MKVLVFGGTGAMGKHLSHLLALAGEQVFVTTRKHRIAENNIHYLQGNAHDVDFLKTILQEHWDVIVDFMIYGTLEFKQRVQLLLEATSQYVFLSSARVYAESTEAISENSPRLIDTSSDEEFLSTDEYSLTKARQENILIKTGRKNWTIIRPYITYSENRLQLGVLEKEEWLFRALSGRTIVFSKDINTKVTTLTYGLDVAKGVLALLNKSSTLGETYHISRDDSTAWVDVLTIYLNALEEYLGRKPKVKFVGLENTIKIHPAVYQLKYDRLYDRKFNNSKISQYIDQSCFKNLEEGLKSCLNEFLKVPEFKKINWKMEAIKDKLTKEHTSLVEIKEFRHKVRYIVYRYLI